MTCFNANVFTRTYRGTVSLTKSVFVSLFVLTLSAGFSAVSADNALSQTIEKIRPSIVGIGTVMQTRSPPASFRGTGFVVGDGLHIITNAHVVSPLLDTEQKEMLAIFVGRGESAQARQATKVAVDAEHDLALLKITGAPLPAMTIGDSNSAKEGDEFAFTGFPIGMVLGLYPVTHRATVSALTPIVTPALSARQLDAKSLKRIRTPFEVFQLDATAYPGNSGSPLYDPATGKVYGIINMVFVKGTKENAITNPSGIAYAIPANYIYAIMQQNP